MPSEPTMTVSIANACSVVVRIMSLNKFYSDSLYCNLIKIPVLSAAKIYFYKPNVTSQNCSLMHNTSVFTSHGQNINSWAIVEYHNKLRENSKWNFTFVWAPEKMSKNVCPSLWPIQQCTYFSKPHGDTRWRIHTIIGLDNVFGLLGQPHHCLLNRLFRCKSKKTPKLRFTGLCTGNSSVTGDFPHKWPVTRKMFPFDDLIMGQ